MVPGTSPTLTHPERVLWPEQGLTKGDLARHYQAVSDRMLPYVGGRPLSLVRCPRGREGTCFWQKHVTDATPAAIRRVRVQEAGGVGVYHWVDDLAGLLALVQMGTLEIHVWGSRVDDLDRPDRMVFDLDPGPGVAAEEVVDAARELRERLALLHLASYPMLSGGKGVHLVVPLGRRAPWERVSRFARGVAEAAARDRPERWVTTAAKTDRPGRIFLDWLRNTRGATAVACYSTRARRGAPVATPIRWDELRPDLPPDRYDPDSVRRRLAALSADPWAGFLEGAQAITRAAELRLRMAD